MTACRTVFVRWLNDNGFAAIESGDMVTIDVPQEFESAYDRAIDVAKFVHGRIPSVKLFAGRCFNEASLEPRIELMFSPRGRQRPNKLVGSFRLFVRNIHDGLLLGQEITTLPNGCALMGA